MRLAGGCVLVESDELFLWDTSPDLRDCHHLARRGTSLDRPGKRGCAIVGGPPGGGPLAARAGDSPGGGRSTMPGPSPPRAAAPRAAHPDGDRICVRAVLPQAPEGPAPPAATGCVRNGTRGVAAGCRGQHETGPADGQAASISAIAAAHRPWNRCRCAVSERCSPDRPRARKYRRCSSKAGQKRAAATYSGSAGPPSWPSWPPLS